MIRHGGQSWEQRRFNRREGNPPPVPPAGEIEPYSGIDTALKSLGHVLYNEESINAKLTLQSSINPVNPASRATFWEFVTNVQ